MHVSKWIKLHDCIISNIAGKNYWVILASQIVWCSETRPNMLYISKITRESLKLTEGFKISLCKAWIQGFWFFGNNHNFRSSNKLNCFSVGVVLISNRNTNKMKIHAHLILISHTASPFVLNSSNRYIKQKYPNVKLSIATTPWYNDSH